jgi:hypothetical protein
MAAVPKPRNDPSRKSLTELRHALVNLHKTLVETERMNFEKSFGRIQSANQFLQLLTSDPLFAWLRQLSQLIVSMDEALDAEEPLTNSGIDGFFNQTGLLLLPDENGNEFARKYFEAMQRSPDVVLAHGEVAKVRDSRKPPLSRN